MYELVLFTFVILYCLHVVDSYGISLSQLTTDVSICREHDLSRDFRMSITTVVISGAETENTY